MSWLLEIDRKCAETLPINFEYFGFNAYAASLKTFKKAVTTKHQLAPTEVPDSGETVIITNKVTICLGVGSFPNVCSVLSHLFLECNVDKSATQASRFYGKNYQFTWRELIGQVQGSTRSMGFVALKVRIP